MKKIFLVLSILLLIYSIFNIFNWFDDSSSIAKESEEIVNTVSANNTNETTEVADDVKTYQSSVNFTPLEQLNSDVVGWIKVDGTDIDYPFVQTTDNSYYLNHSFTKEENKSGWIFLDYRNDINNLGKNTIIYGHSRYDSSMFGSLRNSLKQTWFNNSENREIHLYTKNGDTVWQIFSVYHLPNTTDYLATSFKDSTEFNSFIKLIKNRSIFNFGIDISKDDKIITLSTCYRLDDRMVMHGKLIK